MDISTWVRKPEEIHASLVETAKGALITKTGCKIYIPKRFQDYKLATIANEIRIVGVFAMVIGERYGVSKACAMMQITPSSTTIVEINGDECYEFTFEKGGQITPNMNLVKDDTVVYCLYDEIVAKGHVPWYFSYEDLGKLFDTALYHGNMRLSANNVPLEMIAASIARSSADRTVYYRHTITKIEDQLKTPPYVIPFRNVMYGATNVTAKLMGAYFDDGLLSACVNPSETTEGVENLLRA